MGDQPNHGCRVKKNISGKRGQDHVYIEVDSFLLETSLYDPHYTNACIPQVCL